MTKVFLSLCSIVALVGSASASTVAMAKGLSAGFNVTSPTGTVLTNFTMSFGAFATNPAAGITAAQLKTLLTTTTSFSEFAAATAPVGGLLTASVTNNTFAAGTPQPAAFNGKNIYVVVMDGATATASNAFSLITLDTTSPAGTWVFPADVTSALVTTNAPSATTTSFLTVLGNEIAGTPNSLQLSAVPEPTVSLMGLIGAIGFLARRRR